VNIFYVAAFASKSDTRWFSLGRQRKVEQVISMLKGLGPEITCLNISPCDHVVSSQNILNLCNSSFVPLRFLQILLSSCRLFWFATNRHSESILWLYNTRAAESIVAITCLLLRPSFHVILQLEDLPSARQENHNFAGWIDGLCNSFLSNKASLVFAVGPNVAKEYSLLTGFRQSQVNLLPPALHYSYLDTLNCRVTPFASPQPSILYAGSYQSDKGVLDLIEAFLELEPGTFNLYLVGSSPSSLRETYASYPNIFFTGVVSDGELFSLYSMVDIIVNPHRPILNPSFVFPFKLVEIVASGAFPLSTPVPGIELFSLPQDCIFTGVDELAFKLLHSRSLWQKNRMRIEEIAEQCKVNFSYQTIQSGLHSALSNLLNSST
jgi:glycosyltransferase involved in cell wall biosynthesis